MGLSSFAQGSELNGRIYIEVIKCEGRFRTSCRDLAKMLGIKSKSYISEDELSALNAKFEQIGHYSSYAVSLEPLQTPGHANLILQIEEKETGRHGILTRGLGGAGNIPAFGQYSFTDTNLFGKGLFFHGSASATTWSSVPALKSLKSFSLELATPVQDSFIGSVRLLTPRPESEEVIGLVGLGLSTGYNSAITLYAGNAIGANFTYTTEDNSFIPKSGVKLSATYLYTYMGKKSYDFGLDSRANFQIGRIQQFDGVFSLGLVSKPQLNPSFYSFEGQQASNPFPEGGITYSLVRAIEKDRRVGLYMGIGNARILKDENTWIIHGGFKAALENLDLNIGLILARDSHL